MKHFYHILLAVGSGFAFMATGTIAAQTTHNVTVGSFQFSPSTLAIDVGDVVSWTNVDGFHNVDGLTATFPDNPESFTSGDPQVAPWSYSKAFTVPGTYHYQCDVHAGAMQGTIVVGTVGLEDVDGVGPKVYPNPTSDHIFISGIENLSKSHTLMIYDVTGKKVLESFIAADAAIDVSSLKSGVYSYTIQSDKVELKAGKLYIE